MSDQLQAIIVTLMAALALVTLVWPYVRRSSPSSPCARCGSAARRAPLTASQPLRFVGSTKRR